MGRKNNKSGWKPVFVALYLSFIIFFFLFLMMVFVRWQNECDSLLPWDRYGCKQVAENLQ